MMLLFDIRAKLISVYQKYDYIIKFVLKVILIAVALMKIKSEVGFSTSLSKTSLIMMISVVGAFLPSSLMVLMVIMYLFLQVLAKSSLMALTVLVICIVLYCLFLRFTPKYGAAFVALPILRSLGFPYVLPIGLGLFGNLLAIIPTCCGVFIYYLIAIVKSNILVLEQMSGADNPLIMYMEVLDKLFKNPGMYVVMFIYAVVIIAVYFVRRFNMDYSFEISIGVGVGVMLLGYIIGSLKYDLGVGLVRVFLCTILSAVLVYLYMFFYRVLNYAATEHVQFEDDDYYYYVKAVPKINTSAPKKAVRKVVTRASSADDEEFEDEALEAMDSLLWNESGAGKAKVAQAAPLTGASAEDDEDDDDSFDDEIGASDERELYARSLRVSAQSSGASSKTAPTTSTRVAQRVTSKAPSDVAPKAASKPTSSVAPKAAPKVAPKAAPKTAPKAAPVVNEPYDEDEDYL